MKNTILVIILIIIVGLAIYIFATNTGDETVPEEVREEEGAVQNNDADNTVVEVNDPEEITAESGSYEEYSENKLSRADDGDVVLFFHASWCPTCRSLESNILSNTDSIPEGVSILKVDYDSNSALRQEYGVTYQHTLVQVDSSGKLIKKWTGSPTLEFLVQDIV